MGYPLDDAGQGSGAGHGQYPPLVNASRRPGEWQSFDIVLETAAFGVNGLPVRPARLTLVHNGVTVHHAVEMPARQGEFTITLQDHGNPVRFRNFWLRPLTAYDEGGTPPPTPANR